MKKRDYAAMGRKSSRMRNGIRFLIVIKPAQGGFKATSTFEGKTYESKGKVEPQAFLRLTEVLVNKI